MRRSSPVSPLGALSLVCLLAASGGGAAGAGAADCGVALSEPMRALWLAGGGAGLLGCPLDAAPATLTSPSGVTARQARFAAAAILQHATGPRAGRTFLVTGCAYRLYFQYGGVSGWLGLPIGDAANTADGKRQPFENGVIRADRNGACEARAGAPAVIGAAGPSSPIDLFHAQATGDDSVAGTSSAAARLTASGYRRAETLGYGPATPGAGEAELRQFVDDATGAHLAVATSEGEADARAKGFRFDGAQGYVLSDPAPGRLALKLYWNAATRRGLLASSPADEADALARGYVFLRVEGFVLAKPGN